jgi:ankyrin repeat protein
MSDPFETFLAAAKSGDYVLLDRVLQSLSDSGDVGSFVNRRNSFGATALHIASSGSFYDICDCLVRQGALVNTTDLNATTPLHHAAQNGHLEIVEFLITKNAFIDPKDNHNATPLFLASRHNHPEVVEYLADRGADVNAVTSKRTTPLQAAAQRGNTATVEKLLSCGARVNNKRKGETSALLLAVRAQKPDVVRLLLANRADVNYVDANGHTALVTAVQCRNATSEVLELVLDAPSINLSVVSADKKSALALAIESGREDLFDVLASREGHDWGTRDGQGRTLVHAAVQVSSKSLLEKVLSRSVDANVPDANGDTPLHIAAGFKGFQEGVEILLRRGCNPWRLNKKRWTAFAMATQENAALMAKLLQNGDIAEEIERKKADEQDKQEQQVKARVEEKASCAAATRTTPRLTAEKRATLATMTMHQGRLRPKGTGQGKKAGPTVARPWGGSREAEAFQREVRLQLRKLRSDVDAALRDIEDRIAELKSKLLDKLDDTEETQNIE